MIQLYAILDCDNKKMNNLQLPQKHMEKEIAQLESFIKSDIDARELKRAIAVRMAISGNIYHEISLILGVSNFFIGYWKKQFKTKGIAGIKLGHKGSKAEMLNFDTKLYISRYSKTNQVKNSTKHEFLKPMNKTNFLTHTSLKIANLI